MPEFLILRLTKLLEAFSLHCVRAGELIGVLLPLGIPPNKKTQPIKVALKFLFGGAKGDRTPDLIAASDALYRVIQFHYQKR